MCVHTDEHFTKVLTGDHDAAQKLLKARQGSTQGRLDSFFKVLPSTPNGSAAGKRKSEDGKGSSAKKAKTAGGKKGHYKR